MFIITNPIQLYGKSILVDVAFRTGPSDSNCYSPFNGLMAVVDKYSKGSPTASIEYMLSRQSDFDADYALVAQDKEEVDENGIDDEVEADSVEYKPSVDKYDDAGYKRRLEDIHVEFISKYLGNVLYNINNKSAAKGIIQDNKEHKIQEPLYGDDDDDDGVTELSDLWADVDDSKWTADQKADCAAELPFILKRLNMLSKYSGVHMLSLISAFAKALKVNASRRMSGSTADLTCGQVLECAPVYLCTDEGIIRKRSLAANKNKKVILMYQWLCGNTTEYSAFRPDYINFMHCVDVLNIDLDEDMSKYDGPFIDSLGCITLTPNTQYDVGVHQALLDNERNLPEVKVTDALTYTALTFNNLLITNPDLSEELYKLTTEQRTKCIEAIENLVFMFLTYHPIDNKPFNKRLINCRGGYVYYGDTLLQIQRSFITSAEPIMLSSNICIISDAGYVVLCVEDARIPIISVFDAIENITQRIRGYDADYHDAKWEYRV